MLIIRSAEDLTRALEGPLSPSLQTLLRRRMDQLGGYDLADVACFLVVQEGDTAADIGAGLGFSILRNFVDGSRFGDPAFMPSWEWIGDHGDWFELVFVLSDDGFGWAVFIANHEDTDPELLSLCRAYAGDACQDGQ